MCSDEYREQRIKKNSCFYLSLYSQTFANDDECSGMFDALRHSIFLFLLNIDVMRFWVDACCFFFKNYQGELSELCESTTKKYSFDWLSIDVYIEIIIYLAGD